MEGKSPWFIGPANNSRTHKLFGPNKKPNKKQARMGPKESPTSISGVLGIV